MNLEKLNKLLILFANFGVLVGIIFLALEIQQNTTMMRASTRDSMTQQLTEWQLAIATDPETAQLYQKGNTEGFGGLERTQAENISYGLIANSIFRIWENEFYQYRLGLFDDHEFIPRMERWEQNLRSNSGYRDVWSFTRSQFSTDFQQLIDSFID